MASQKKTATNRKTTTKRKAVTSLIDFICPQCGNAMSADAKKAGTRGRCPKCQRIITIPKQSVNVPEDFDPSTFFENEKLSAFYSEFLARHGDRVIAEVPMSAKDQGMDFNGDLLTMILSVNNGRKQHVGIGINPATESFMFMSLIGLWHDDDIPTAILKCDRAGSTSIFIDASNKVMCVCQRKVRLIDYEEFEELIFLIAEHADNLERFIHGGDTV